MVPIGRIGVKTVMFCSRIEVQYNISYQTFQKKQIILLKQVAAECSIKVMQRLSEHDIFCTYFKRILIWKTNKSLKIEWPDQTGFADSI